MMKHKLLAKNRAVVEIVDIDGDKVEIRKPTGGDRARALESARLAGELGDDNQPKGELNATRLMARIVSAVLYDPATGQRVFQDEDIEAMVDAPWLEEIVAKCSPVFSPAPSDVRGK